MTSQPTAYPDVNDVLAHFSTHVQTILGKHFVGMYLYGSLALGDFDPETSDIDIVVVTDTELPTELVGELQTLHDRFNHSGSPWAERIEASYVPQGVLGRPAPPEARYPQIEKGRELKLDALESGWMVQCYVLREHGITVAGPQPRTLMPEPIDQHWMRQAASYAEVWLEHARHDPAWLAWLRHRDHQAFVVLTLCRMLYTLDSGAVASKPAAARWAQQRLGTWWAALIGRAIEGQHADEETSESEVLDTVALVKFTVERYRSTIASQQERHY